MLKQTASGILLILTERPFKGLKRKYNHTFVGNPGRQKAHKVTLGWPFLDFAIVSSWPLLAPGN